MSVTVNNTLFRRLLGGALGAMFQGKRNLYQVFGYAETITPEMLFNKYRRQDITRRVVNEPTNAVWDYSPTVGSADEIIQTDDPGILTDRSARKVNDWFADHSQRLRLWSTFSLADKLLYFNKYSIIYLGFPGPASSPVREATIENLRFLKVFGASQIQITAVEKDINNPRFGMPTEYQVDLSKGIQEELDASVLAALPTQKLTIHWSRVIHVVDDHLQSRIYATPRLEPVYNLLDDILKVGGGSAETYWLTANRGMQVDVDKEMDLTAEDEKALSDELDEYQHQLRRYIRTRGVKINSLGSDTPDPRGTFGVLISLLAAATGIPQRLLVGSEAGQLASEQDRANWAEVIRQRREHFAEPQILVPFVERLQQLGAVPNKPFAIEWPDAFHQSPLERAQTMAQFGRALANITRQAQFDNPITTVEEARVALGLPKDMPKGTQFKLFSEVQKELGDAAAARTGNENTGNEGRSTDSDGNGIGMSDPNQSPGGANTGDGTPTLN